jgi:hypothetical protein
MSGRANLAVAEGPMQCLEDFADLRAGERIVNIFTILPGFDAILGSQPRQLLRDRRLSACNQLCKLGHGLLASDQQTQDDWLLGPMP